MKVLFAEYLTWNTPYRVGSHYYARHFVELGWEVGWLGGEFHLLNLVHNRAELHRKAPLWRTGGVRHTDGPWEYVPFKLVPYRDWGPLSHPSLAWHSARLTIPPIKRVLSQHGFDRADLVWLSNPQAYPWLIDEPGYDHIVYRAADNHALSQGIPVSVMGIEEQIARKADAVLVVHPDSLERFGTNAPGRTIHMPNGVDLSRFLGEPAPPQEYAALSGPIAVYVGSINYRFDTALLAEVAAMRPGVSFVIIGEPVIDASALSTQPNILLLGARPPEMVPAYLRHADAGLIPFHELPATHNLFSIKIYEYAASGIPTVHASMDAQIASGLPIISATGGVRRFCEALDTALGWSANEKAKARSFAAANSWDDRYRRLDEIIARWS